MKFSIITPMYNSFHLMDPYFRSLEKQTYKDFEVIIIDDCSTDNSYENIKKYMSKSNLNIKLLKTPQNMGPGFARNMGIDAANGEWITFVDNDDWVELDWLEKVKEVISNYDVDCVIHNYYLKGKNKQRHMNTMLVGDEGILPKSFVIMYVSNHTCGKFYKRDNCIKNLVRFPNTRRCEDVAFTCLAIDASNSIYYLKKPLYYYYQRKTSLSNSTKLDENDLMKTFTILEKRLGEKYEKEIQEKSVRDLLYGVVLIMCKAKKSTKEIRKYINRYEEKYSKWYRIESLSYLRLFKRVFLIFVRFRFIFGLRILSLLHNKLVGN